MPATSGTKLSRISQGGTWLDGGVDEVIRLLGSTPSKDRHPCPLCGARHGIAVDERGGKVLVYCHGCNGDVWGWLEKNGLRDQQPARNRARPHLSSVEPRASDPKKQESDRFEKAAEILYAAARSGRRANSYLKARGIQIVPKNAYLLPEGRFRHPCAVFPIRGPGRQLGVHVIFLDQKAKGKARIENPKRTFGIVNGGYVQLGRPDPDRPLIVAEGIETALSAAQIAGGLSAVSTLGTAGMKNLSRVPPCKEVIIARDLGKPGREAAEVLARRLVVMDHTVRISAPPKKKTDGKWWDWNDWLLRGSPGDKKALKRLVLKAKKVNATLMGDALSMKDFIDLDLPPLSFLIDPILVRPGMTMLHARPGGGKTRLALSMAYAYATGVPLMDWTISEPGKVLYIDAEMTPESMKQWLGRLGPPTNNLKIISDKWNYRVGKPRVSLSTEADREYLTEQIGLFGPDLVILDSLFVLAPPEMSQGKVSEESWSSVLEWIRGLKREGRHIVVCHHDNKTGSQFGSSLKEIEFDLGMQLKTRKDLNTPGKWHFELSFSKPRHLSSEDAESSIVAATDSGIIQWERTDRPLDAREAKGQKNREAVAALDAEGLTTGQIANKLDISKRAVQKIKKALAEDNKE